MLHDAMIMIISKRRVFRLIYKYKRYIICEIYISVRGRGTALLTFISVSVQDIAYANDYDSSSINTNYYYIVQDDISIQTIPRYLQNVL